MTITQYDAMLCKIRTAYQTARLASEAASTISEKARFKALQQRISEASSILHMEYHEFQAATRRLAEAARG